MPAAARAQQEQPAVPQLNFPAQPGQPDPSQDDKIVQPPAQEKPEERIKNLVAEFTGIDKITGRIISFDVYMDETVQFGALQVTPRVCYSRPPTEQPKTTSFVEVDEVTEAADLLQLVGRQRQRRRRAQPRPGVAVEVDERRGPHAVANPRRAGHLGASVGHRRHEQVDMVVKPRRRARRCARRARACWCRSASHGRWRAR